MIFLVGFALAICGIFILFATTFLSTQYEYGSENKKIVMFFWSNDFVMYLIGGALAVIFGVTSLIAAVCVVDIQISAHGLREGNEQRYNALVYKAQTESIRDEFGIVNKEYVDEIQEWNEELVKYKAYSENPWISIFYPAEVYEGLETINLEEIKIKD